MTFPVVHVIWRDSEANAEWTPVEDIPQDLDVTHTVGFLINETESYFLLALTYDPATESIINSKRIPRVAVERVRTLCRLKMTT